MYQGSPSLTYSDVLLRINLVYIPLELGKLIYKILNKSVDNNLGEKVVMKPLLIQLITYVIIWVVMTSVAFVG